MMVRMLSPDQRRRMQLHHDAFVKSHLIAVLTGVTNVAEGLLRQYNLAMAREENGQVDHVVMVGIEVFDSDDALKNGRAPTIFVAASVDEFDRLMQSLDGQQHIIFVGLDGGRIRKSSLARDKLQYKIRF